MGAGYGGTGASLTYQQSASFTQKWRRVCAFLLSYDALGIGFDNALFTISLNSIVFDSWCIMASGHVNRTNRPNTWPHRPMLHS
jgi:hypothetical protein